MAEIIVTVDHRGRAYVNLAGRSGEVRSSVPLDTLDEAQAVPSLEAIVLDFDHYGRLTGIEITDSAATVLPPSLLDAAQRV